MTDRLAPADLRVLAPRAFALGTADDEALQNVDTTKLPNGALAYASDMDTYYKFLRDGGFAPAGPGDPSVIVPSSGPGVWLAISGFGVALALSYQIAMNNAPQVISASNNYEAMPGTTAWTDQDVAMATGSLSPTAFWSVASPGPGVLTYAGPTQYFQVVAGIVCTAEGSNPQQYGIYISRNGIIIGSNPDQVRDSINSGPLDPAQVPIEVHTSSRILLGPTDTVQIAVINRAGEGDDVNVLRASLSVYPI